MFKSKIMAELKKPSFPTVHNFAIILSLKNSNKFLTYLFLNKCLQFAINQYPNNSLQTEKKKAKKLKSQKMKEKG